MSGLFPVAGSKLFIGARVTAKGTVQASDFAGAAWTLIDGWANAGAIGDTQDVGEQPLISDNRMRKFKTILNGGTMENQFVPMALDAGQTKFKQAIADCQPYQFKIEWGANCSPTATVTISNASPAVVSWTGHGLVAGQPVVLSTTGALPTGLTEATVYYVIASGLSTDAFSVSATAGGSAINTSGAGSGTHTAVAPPAGMTDLFFGLALPGARQGGTATSVHLRNWSIAVDSNILEV